MGDCPESNATGSWGNWSKFWTVPGKLLGEGGFPLHGLNHMGVSINGGTPSYHPFSFGIFHCKPTVLGIPHVWKPTYAHSRGNWFSQQLKLHLLFGIFNYKPSSYCGTIDGNPHVIMRKWPWPMYKGYIYSIITSRILLNWQEEHEHSK